MPEHIGNAGIEAMAWAERTIVSFGPQARRSTGLGPPTHESTHILPQTQPQRLLQRRVANRVSSLIPVALTMTSSDAWTALPTPLKNKPVNTTTQRQEAQPQASKPRAAEALAEKRAESHSPRNAEEVANRVYRLMQNDLILERERANKLGG